MRIPRQILFSRCVLMYGPCDVAALVGATVAARDGATDAYSFGRSSLDGSCSTYDVAALAGATVAARDGAT